MKNYLQLALTVALVFVLNISFGQNEIIGKVVYHNTVQTPLPGVQVYLNDINGNPVQSLFSNATGNFTFSGVAAGTYKITASSNQAAPAAVNLLDVSLFIDYLNGVATIDSLQAKAANVDGSPQIDTADLNFLMENWYLNGEAFPIGNWVFEEHIVQAGGKGGEIVVNGGCVADVTSDYEPEKKSQFQMTNLNPVDVSPFSYLDLPIKSISNAPIKSFYIEMAFDQTAINGISIEAQLPGLKYSVMNDRIKMIWADATGKGMALDTYESLFTIRLHTQNIQSIDHKNLRFTQNCSFVSASNEFTFDVALQIPKAKVLSSNTTTFSNYPNPASTSITFDYALPSEGTVTIDIMNSLGSVVLTARAGIQNQGINTMLVNTNSLKPGYYFARLILNSRVMASKTLIIR